jgi:AAA+ ATPase superfamily predicted ATPase
MFVGRDRELAELRSLYDSKGFQCVVLWGRRRVGKTTLITEFCKDRECVYFTALETSERENIESLSRAILSDSSGTASPVFSDYQSAFEYLAEKAKKRRIVVALDEYPYLAKSWPGISSLLQTMIDQKLKKTELFLILCGSSMSFMENQVLGYQSPLYGRRTAQFKIEPLNFHETVRFFPKYTLRDIAVVYGITGGVPLYLEQFDDRISFAKNITRAFFSPSAYLFEEPLNLLKQEVRDPAYYNAIVKTVVDGATRLGEIATKVGLETSACTVYLKNLIDLGILKKEFPVGERSPRKGIYTIEDHLFRFWYLFVSPHISMIQRGMADAVWTRVEPDIPRYMGPVFEDICREYLWCLNAAGTLSEGVTEIGRWWGTDERTKSESEIDIVGLNGSAAVLFGECKWTEKDVDKDVLELLVERSMRFSPGSCRYFLFAKKGFTARCRAQAEARGDTVLVTLEEIQSSQT